MRNLKRSLVSFGAIAAWLMLGSSVQIGDNSKPEPVKDFLYNKYSQKSLHTKIHFTTFAHASVNPKLSLKEAALTPLGEVQEPAPYAFMSESAISTVMRMHEEAANSFQEIPLDRPIKGHNLDNLWGRVFEKSPLLLTGRGIEFGYKRSLLYDEIEEPLEELAIGHSVKGHSPFARAAANFGATLLSDELALQGTIKIFDENEQNQSSSEQRQSSSEQRQSSSEPKKFEAKTTTPVQPASLTSPANDLQISTADYKRTEKCLADAVYFESRSEPERGQMAVAQVIVNRALSGYYPNNICGVVYQNAHRYLACQFTFACEGKKLIVTEKDHWARATRIARDMLAGKIWLKDVANATHYHASYVSPYWAKSMKKHQKIGLHHFYRPKEWN